MDQKPAGLVQSDSWLLSQVTKSATVITGKKGRLFKITCAEHSFNLDDYAAASVLIWMHLTVYLYSLTPPPSHHAPITWDSPLYWL